MGFQSVVGKMGNMRKAVNWVVYPVNSAIGAHMRVIQADARIALVNLETGKAVLSKGVPSGAYFPHLSAILGATTVDCPVDIMEQLKAMTPHVGPVSLSEMARGA